MTVKLAAARAAMRVEVVRIPSGSEAPRFVQIRALTELGWGRSLFGRPAEPLQGDVLVRVDQESADVCGSLSPSLGNHRLELGATRSVPGQIWGTCLGRRSLTMGGATLAWTRPMLVGRIWSEALAEFGPLFIRTYTCLS